MGRTEWGADFLPPAWSLVILLCGCTSHVGSAEQSVAAGARDSSATGSGGRDGSVDSSVSKVDASDAVSPLGEGDASAGSSAARDASRRGVDAWIDASEGPGGFDLSVPTCDELETGTGPAFPAPASTSLGFDDVSAVVGLPTMYGATASFGDLNDDGWPDVFVPRYVLTPLAQGAAELPSVVLVNCAGRFHPVSLQLSFPVPWGYGRLSAISDLDHDGRQDLLLADDRSLAVVLNHRAGAELRTLWSVPWVSGPVWLSSALIADLDVDGELDLYVSRFGGENGLLLGTGSGGFVDVTGDHPEILATSATETYSASLIAAPADGSDDLLYVGNHAAPDALLAVHRPLGFTVLANDLSPVSTMGIDHFTRDDGERVLVTMSDARKLWLYELSGGLLRDVSGRLPVVTELDFWGMRFEDFDNDGFVDLVIGEGAAEPQLGTSSRLAVMRGTSATGEVWVDARSGAGPLFDGSASGSYYSIATADFDLDGCVDLLVTPVAYMGRVFAQPIKLLRNRCGYPGHWLELTIADDPGAHIVAILQEGDGGTTTRRFEVRAASGVASRSMNHQVHIGLGASDQLVGVHVRCRDGRQLDLTGAELPLDTVHRRPDICAPP